MIRLAANGDVGSDVVGVFRRSSDGYAWNGSAYVPVVSADLDDYAYDAADPQDLGDYEIYTPAGLPDGAGYVTFYYVSDTNVGLQASDAPGFASKNFTLGATPVIPTTNTGDNQTTYEAQLVLLDNAINNLLGNPRPNYQVNGVRMDYGALLSTLMNARAQILTRLNSIPAVGEDAYDEGVTIFGQDISAYVGDQSWFYR